MLPTVKTTVRRILAALLCAALFASLLPISVLAAEAEDDIREILAEELFVPEADDLPEPDEALPSREDEEGEEEPLTPTEADLAPASGTAPEETGTVPGETEPGPEPGIITAELPLQEPVAAEWNGRDNDELFALYVEQLFYPGSGQKSTRRGTAPLSELDQKWYGLFLPCIADVAAGRRSSTIFEFILEDLDLPALEWTAGDLGVSAVVVNNSISSEAMSAATALLYCNLETVLAALLSNCPYELYWYDKTVGVGCRIPGFSAEKKDGEWVLRTGGTVYYYFTVAEGYRTENDYEVKNEAADDAGTAAANARAIVAEYAALDDIAKLTAYKNRICSLVEYNGTAAGGGVEYGDPWQLVYVFDGDESTNVVCEGYSKAFKYLCDMSTFRGAVDCILVSGIMTSSGSGGRHMWNVVDPGAGANYLVDVTNCDAGTIGAPDVLFLAPCASGSVAEGYIFTDTYGRNVKYVYDNDDSLSMLLTFGEAALTISDTPLAGEPELPSSGVTEDGLTWALNETEDGIVITGYTDAPAADAVIPAEINGLPVTEIAEGAFVGCGLTGVTIPGSVTAIGEDAFSECTELDRIIFAGDIPSIDPTAFENVTADAYYPGGNATYTTERRDDYGGTLTWRALCTDQSETHTHGETVIENRVEPTCTDAGSYDEVVCCSVCGEELSRETVELEATGHTHDETVIENEVEPTCTVAGSCDEVIYCSVCGEELSREAIELEATGHTPGETAIENRVEPTYTEEGSYDEVIYCSACGEELSRETVTIPCLLPTSGVTEDSLVWVVSGAGASVVITGYTDDLPADAVIPAEIRGLPVTMIGDGALSGSPVQSMEIPASVAVIGEGAFSGSGLRTIRFAHTASDPLTIGDGAFASAEGAGGALVLMADENDVNPALADYDWAADGRTIYYNCEPVTITLQPVSTGNKKGKKVTLTVEATGTDIQYQWYYRTSSAKPWVRYTGAGADSPSITLKVKKSGYQYYCLVSNAAGSAESDIATVLILKKPGIKTQPKSRNAAEGVSVTLAVKASGKQLTYQWYCRTSSAGAWEAIEGAVSSSLTVTAAEGGTKYQYRCRVHNGAGTTWTKTVTVTSFTVAEITLQPESRVVASGKKTTLTVGAVGTSLKYQWYYRTGATGKWKKYTGKGKTSPSITVTVKKNGYEYRCKVYNKVSSVYSDAAVLTRATKPAITRQPVSAVIPFGGTAVFTVAASGAELSYQWQTLSPEMVWTDIAGANGDTLSASAGIWTAGTQFRCAVTNPAGISLSAAVSFTECDRVAVTDMAGREIVLEHPADKIVALSPADCEILCDLGAGGMLAGRGTYCDYPDMVQSLQDLGSGPDTDVDAVIAAAPDVLIVSKDSLDDHQIAAVESAGIPVVMTDARDIEGVYENILLIGALVGREDNARAIVASMQTSLAELRSRVAAMEIPEDRKPTIYFEGSPLYYGLWAAGSGTFMNEIADLLGMVNIFRDNDAWEAVTEDQIIAADPDYIVTITVYTGSEYESSAAEILARPGWENVTAVKNGAILPMTNNELSRSTPRLAEAAQAIFDFVYGG